MSKMKKIIRRKYSDFYTPEDLREKRKHTTNISINDLDEKGCLISPKAPCTVTLIDPYYKEDSNCNRNYRKFKVKSDILLLRDVMKKRFVYYVTQQRVLEKAREQKFQEKMFQETQQFMDMSSKQLMKMKKDAFYQMLAKNEELKKLQSVNPSAELKECMETYQKLSMEAKDVHKRFLFLLKLIGYFDISPESLDLRPRKLDEGEELTFLKSDLLPEDVTTAEIAEFKSFKESVIDPYLEKRSYLSAERWTAGYESTREKLFDYYKEFTNLAILNHIATITHLKFLKTHSIRIAKPIIRKTPQFFHDRKEQLQTNADQMLRKFEQMKIRSKKNCRIEGIAPVLLEKIQSESRKEEDNEEKDAISNFEEIHTILMGLLTELDKMDATVWKKVEKEVRRRTAQEKKMSQKVLIKVNRFENWLEHYKKHLKK